MVRLLHQVLGKPLSLGSEDERDLAGEVELVQRRGAVRDERHPLTWSVVEGEQRNPEDRAGRCSEGFRTERIGAALGERDRRTERVRGAEQRPDVSRIGDTPERQRRLTRLVRQRRSPEDTDDAGRMSQRRDGGEQLGLDGLSRNEKLDRLDAGRRGGADQVLALDREEPELLALPLLREELPDELQRRVRR